MRSFLFPSQAIETISQTVRVGRTSFKCTFTMVYSRTAVDINKSKAKCSPKTKKGTANNLKLISNSGVEFTISLNINKPTRITKGKIGNFLFQQQYSKQTSWKSFQKPSCPPPPTYPHQPTGLKESQDQTVPGVTASAGAPLQDAGVTAGAPTGVTGGRPPC